MHYSPSTNGFYTPEIHGDNIPVDALEITGEQHAALLAGQGRGKVITAGPDGQPTLQDPPAPTPEHLQAALTAQIQQRLDDFAKDRGYDSMLSACTYATSSVPRFAADGQYAVEARDATWTAAHVILAEVQAGARPMPSSMADMADDLPDLAWPQA